jgi:hypothetical protein
LVAHEKRHMPDIAGSKCPAIFPGLSQDAVAVLEELQLLDAVVAAGPHGVPH